MPQNALKNSDDLKGNEATIDNKSPNYQVLKPLRQPRDTVTYRKIGPGVVDPVANADAQLAFLEADYPKWLREDRLELHAAWMDLRGDPQNAACFVRFHKAVHTIAGNAAVLNCAAASRLAAPLGRLLERRPPTEEHLSLIQSAVDAIDSAIIQSIADDDPRMHEVITGLEKIVKRWIARQH